jgi:hypothetical protein
MPQKIHSAVQTTAAGEVQYRAGGLPSKKANHQERNSSISNQSGSRDSAPTQILSDVIRNAPITHMHAPKNSATLNRHQRFHLKQRTTGLSPPVKSLQLPATMYETPFVTEIYFRRTTSNPASTGEPQQLRNVQFLLS